MMSQQQGILGGGGIIGNAVPSSLSATTYMVQNAIVGAASKFIESGIWWLDMILLIFVMSFVASVMQSFPNWISEIHSWLYSKYRSLKGVFIKNYELELTDTVYINATSGFSWRPAEIRNNMYMVSAVTYYVNKQKNIMRIKASVRNDGLGGNEYERHLDHSIIYDSCDSTTILPNGITVFIQKTDRNSSSTKGDVSVETVYVTLRSSISHEHIKEFLEKVYKEYIECFFKKYDTGQQLHFYTLDAGRSFSLTSTVSNKTEQMQLSNWRRYDLEVARTFDSLFFDEKTSVLSLIENFLEKKGMYALDSIPYKLSFLLHGSPGTGKTSFIKALANMTKRHIINVSLPLIETNGQILDIFQNTTITYFNNYGKQSDEIPLDRRIYILEDIDALSKIVEIRKTTIAASKQAAVKQVTLGKSKPKTKSDGTSGSTDSGSTSDSDDESTSDETDIETQKKIPVPTPPKPSVDPKSKIESNPLYYQSQYERYMLQSDELNLSGLLNVLDGLMELTGSIIILTTNHPEKLDPALIRPGRITKKLHLGEMSNASIKNMIEYYFKEKIESPLPPLPQNLNVTPAKMENICLTASSVNEVYEELIKTQIL